MDKELCYTCLSKHRNLKPLSALKNISYLLKTILVVDSESPVCWECRAMLQRIQTFIEQASLAQVLLKYYVENKKSITTLQSLSKLSVSVKSNYDANIVYGLKCDSEGSEEIDNFQSMINYDQEEEENIIKIDKFEFEDNFCSSEIADVISEPCLISTVSDDERPLIQSPKKEKVKHKEEDAKKTSPKKNKVIKFDSEIEKDETKTSKDEEKFTIKKITLEELYRLREEDRKNSRYVSCPYKCVTCITGYFREEKYKAHMEMHHSDAIGPHTCGICQRRFKGSSSLPYHHDMHLRSYQCRECNFTSHKWKAMFTHTAKHSLQKESTTTCKECGVSFLKKQHLRYHKEKFHTEWLACDACDKRFINQHSLRRHVFQATMRCGSGARGGFASHNLEHFVGSGPLRTLLQPHLILALRKYMRRHTVHGNAPKETCTQCGRAVRNLRTHLATHAQAAPAAFCADCGKSFRTSRSYQEHLLTHKNHRKGEDVLKFKCDACPRRFGGMTVLKRHVISRHTKQYPYTCPLCSQGFLRDEWLKLHILKKHEGGRPRGEVCSICGEAFKTKQLLTDHVRTHTGEKPVHDNTGGTGNTGGSGKSDKTEFKS